MTEDDLHRLISSGKFISGIHNYCDRWCERCPLTSKCSVFAMEQADRAEDRGSLQPSESDNGAFWGGIENSLALAMQMLERHCKEAGIDLSPESLHKAGEEQKRRHAKVRESDLSKASFRYLDLADKWFDARPKLLAEKGEALVKIAELELPGHDALAEANELRDVIQIIHWYQTLIPAKVERALDGLEKSPEEKEMLSGFPSDADGSAKVALISIDRSLAAWSIMRRLFPEEGDSMLDLLVHLDRLRRGLEQAFPNARQFKRPGFDDPPKKRRGKR